MPGILWCILLVNDGLSKSSGGIKKTTSKGAPSEFYYRFVFDFCDPHSMLPNWIRPHVILIIF